MKKQSQRLQGLTAGILIGAAITGTAAIAANTTTLYDVISGGVKIVVDGREIISTDANGNTVEPFIYNGTTYLPVRAVVDALGKPVYWDGPNFTVYLGDMDGTLEYPTEELSVDDNIGDRWNNSSDLKDNYGNLYSKAINPGGGNYTYEKLCNMKYSRFKGTIYVAEGYSGDDTAQVIIKADGKTIYTSPEIGKTTAPIHFDVNITGCNDLQITATNRLWSDGSCLHIGDAGFYQ